jgi:hypothetical protein
MEPLAKKEVFRMAASLHIRRNKTLLLDQNKFINYA